MEASEEGETIVTEPSVDEMIEAARHLVASCQKSRRVVFLKPRDEEIMIFGTNTPFIACTGTAECRRDCGKICVHAEQAALISAGPKAMGSEVFHLKIEDEKPVFSGPPSCVECSKLMLHAGVSGVWLYQESGWRRWTAVEFHEETLTTLRLTGGANCAPFEPLLSRKKM